MIEIYLLEQLLAVLDRGTFSAASERLHLTQPALSRSMKKLEELLGVMLFERQKNKITLNENGILAAEYAAKILEQEKDMIERIRAFDRSRHTISMGSCAPAPVFLLSPVLSQSYIEMSIATEIKPEDTLLQGLQDDIYQIIVLTHPLEAEEYCSYKWKQEHLFVTLPPAHPLARRAGLYLKELNGQTMLLYSQLGFWHDLLKGETPDSRFLIQNEGDALEELVLASALPAFTTDIVHFDDPRHANRISIPILDPDANVTYYCICKQKEKKRLASFLNRLSD